MGIQGLIPFLKKSAQPITLSLFQNQCAAVDAYGWLHKGAFSCADKLVKGEPTDGYIVYIMKQIDLLFAYNIKPILVFDGCHLPSKSVTEIKRRENREKNRRKAKELLREGKTKEAHECFQRCVDVTSAMAHEVIKACRQRNVDIIVAPYEADAQLAYLNINKLADFVITEDSDLVIFGCSKIVFKMDNNGGGLLIEKDKLHMSMGLSAEKFSFDTFRNMCILSGCDYLPSLHGIGLAKAKKFFQLTTITDVFNVLTRLPSYLKMPQLDVTLEYREGFVRAVNTIRHQLVFDPVTRELRPLTDYSLDFGPSDYPYCGDFMGHDRALQIALGNVDVQTGEIVDYFTPNKTKNLLAKASGWRSWMAADHPSIWQDDYNHEDIYRQQTTCSPPRALSCTAGKSVTVDAKFKKRKLEEALEADDQLSDADITNFYKVSKLSPDEMSLDTPNCTPIDDQESFSETKFQPAIIPNPVSDPVRSPVLPSRRSNPFAKSPPDQKCSILSGTTRRSNVFSGLKNFGPDTPSVRTIVKSRYFSPSATASDKKPTVLQTLDVLDDIDIENISSARKLVYDLTENNGTKEIDDDFRQEDLSQGASPVKDEKKESRNPFKRSTPSFSWKGVSVMNDGSNAPSFVDSQALPIFECNTIKEILPDSPPKTQPETRGKENSPSPKKRSNTSLYFGSVLTPPQESPASSRASKNNFLYGSNRKLLLSQDKSKSSKTSKSTCRPPGLSSGKKQLNIKEMFAFKRKT